jgi:hypothetical protein
MQVTRDEMQPIIDKFKLAASLTGGCVEFNQDGSRAMAALLELLTTEKNNG